MLFPYYAKQLGLLFVLYVIQAVPLGLSAAIPLLLHARGVTYTELAIYAFASLPFSLKLLWAPLVDSTHLRGFGRRKSWLVPTQLLCGMLMLIAGRTEAISEWVGEANATPRVALLSVFFCILYLLMATQDIAVDGWALEILPIDKKKHASTCNTIGQNVGFYLSNIGLLVLSDAETCNKFFRTTPASYGIVSLGGFLQFWGVVMLLVTGYVAFFEHEKPNLHRLDVEDNVIEETSTLHTITSSDRKLHDSMTRLISLRPVQLACFVLLSSRMGFAATDSAGTLKMIEAGVRKENLAIMAPLVMPWGIMSSYVAGKWIGSWKPFEIFRVGFLFRSLMVLVWVGMFVLTRSLTADSSSNTGTALYWTLLYICVSAQQMASEFMFVSQMAFFAQVSDTSIGGSSMTFFNTMGNLGNKWPGMIALATLERSGSRHLDGFVVQSFLCIGIGAAWYFVVGDRALRELEAAPASVWLLGSAGKTQKEIADLELQNLKRTPPLSVCDSSESPPTQVNSPAFATFGNLTRRSQMAPPSTFGLNNVVSDTRD